MTVDTLADRAAPSAALAGAPRRVTVPLREMDDAQLLELSGNGQLYLSIAEMLKGRAAQ